MDFIKRVPYLDWLNTWRNQKIIKVISGVRRCGKSTLFEMFIQSLMEQGVTADQIIQINFEDLENEHLLDYRTLYSHIQALMTKDQMHYIFLDEIQHVRNFEKAVDSLWLKTNTDVYITGSNAYFMSGELATLLSGRFVELSMLPLSFREFASRMQSHYPNPSACFDAYLNLSAFPYVIQYGLGEHEAQEYLQGIYHTVLLKDIVARLRISDVTSLERITKYLFHSIGNRVSALKISNTLQSNGKKIDSKTVDKYIHGLTDSQILYEAPRYNIKGRQFLSTLGKYYVVDIALRNLLVRGIESDLGHILENIVYLELRRRGYKVYVGEIDTREVDFVVLDGNKVQYYQVAATTLSEETLKRELAPLQAIKDNHPKYLLTLDEIQASQDYDGILKRNVIDWLL
ncbi:MAG: ATP-binding protein [Bacteroidia bacterium]|nr:ATP-binding protein [Bacteroidia bacterium]